MGLGKSLTTISVLHTAMYHPKLVHPETKQRLMQRILLVVPVNTLVNWESELYKWTCDCSNPLTVRDLGLDKKARFRSLVRWKRRGGILPMSMQTFVSMCKEIKKEEQRSIKDEFDADILVIDEAHLSLKTKGSKAMDYLQDISSPRRILLTGTPFQNHLMEFYRLITFACPDASGAMDEKEFKLEFQNPINAGQPSNATETAKMKSNEKINGLKKLFLPYIHRRDARVLRDVLPAMQQAVLHVVPTQLQRNLVREFRRQQEKDKAEGDCRAKNFFREMKELLPVHNHPACLLEKENENPWWGRLHKKHGDKFRNIENGGKIVILLHILAYAAKLGEKVLVFSQCLKTLDVVEKALQMKDWVAEVPSLAEPTFDSNRDRLGGWRKDIEYVRIDGGKTSEERGDLIEQFNSTSQDTTTVFLLSSVAGGVGINLQTASRVVLLVC
jgi:SNF2 family DNA or RNA helicase